MKIDCRLSVCVLPASDVLYDSVINFTPGISERPGTAGQDRYYNDDALGSATDLTDLNGNILSTRKWDAFGNLGYTSGYFRGWNEGSGYEEDSASGLRLLGYRYYDPSIGRFLTPDPIGDGSNWYAYCGNNPVTYSDPMGLMAYNMNDDPTANVGMGSDNRRWLGDGYLFTGRGNFEGLGTGGAGAISGLTFGSYCPGGYKTFENSLGFNGSRNLGRVAGGSLVVAGGAVGIARVGAAGGAKLAGAASAVGSAAATQQDKLTRGVGQLGFMNGSGFQSAHRGLSADKINKYTEIGLS